MPPREQPATSACNICFVPARTVRPRRVVRPGIEYDKTVLDGLQTRDLAQANRSFLHGIHSVIGTRDPELRFSLLTGVPDSPTVNRFSGLKNLTDITLDPRHSAACGYTESDLEEVFAPELSGMNRDLIRGWCNSFNWRGVDRAYNRFDMLLLLRNRKFDASPARRRGPTYIPFANPITPVPIKRSARTTSNAFSARRNLRSSIRVSTAFPATVPRKPARIIMATSGSQSANAKPSTPKARLFSTCCRVIRDAWVATCRNRSCPRVLI